MIKRCVKVSVIMPVHNAEMYLEKSVGSLMNQTLKDIEIICINDKSKDDSMLVLEQMQKNDSRIVIYNNDVNLGAAKTRNRGIELARGEYIVFLDSDDYFYPDMLETAYKEAVLQEADLVVWGYRQLKKIQDENGDVKMECIRKFIPQSSPRVNNRVDYLRLVDHVPWNKLVKKELLEQKKIQFQDLPTNDDVFFSLVTAYEARKIVFVNQVFVDYFWMREESLSSLLINKKNYIISAYREILEYIIEHTDDIREIDLFANHILDALISLFGDREKTKRKVKEELEQELQSDSWLLEQFNSTLTRRGLWSHNAEFFKCIQKKECVVDVDPYLYYLDGINALCKNAHNEGKKVALWGCGKIGQGLLEVYSKKTIDVDFVVDGNPNKQGNVWGPYRIEAYESIKGMVDVIIVTTSRCFEEIRQSTEEKMVVKWNQIRCTDDFFNYGV